MQFQSFFQILEGFGFGFALARYIYLKALSDIPAFFLPHARAVLFHGPIIPWVQRNTEEA